MPLPNGVDPRGIIHETCPSAQWLGNRGVLHDENKKIIRKWRTQSWVACALQYKGINRKPLMQPGHYTELFFLDEVTALAAGHRACAECRREDFKRFKAAWILGNPDEATTEFLTAAALDKRIHSGRVAADGEHITYSEKMSNLPDGAVVLVDNEPHTYWKNKLHLWTDRGYVAPRQTTVGGDDSAVVLTPRSIVNALMAGYLPQVHASIGQ